MCAIEFAITVRDSESDQTAIFDRFFRAHAHLDDEFGVNGTGLRLAIVVECVRELGASITCNSIPGVGSTFTVTLPRQPPSGVSAHDTEQA